MAPKQLQKGSRKSAAESSLPSGKAPQSSGKAVLKIHLADPSAERTGSNGVKKQVHWEVDQDVDEAVSLSSLAKEGIKNQRTRAAEFSNAGEGTKTSKVPCNRETQSTHRLDKLGKDEKPPGQKFLRVPCENVLRPSDDDPKNLSTDDFSDDRDPFALIKFPEELTDSERLLKESLEIYSLTAKLVREYGRGEGDMKLKIPVPQEVAAATEQAKRLVKTGTMTVQKTEQRTIFKRPVRLARRLEKVGNGFITDSQSGSFDSGLDYSFDDAAFSGSKSIYDRPASSSNYHATEGYVSKGFPMPSPISPAEPSCNSVYIRGNRISEDSIRNSFSKFGAIVGIKCGLYDKSAIVDFETPQAACAAVAEMNGSYIDGSPLAVSIANPQLCRAFNEYPPFLNEKQKPICTDSRQAVSYEDEEP